MRKLSVSLIFVLLLTLPAALLVTAQSEPPVLKAVLCEDGFTPVTGPAPIFCTEQTVNTGPPSPFGVAQAIELDDLRTALYLQVAHLDQDEYIVTLEGGDLETIIGRIIVTNQGGAGQATYLLDLEIEAGTIIKIAPVDEDTVAVLRGTFEMVGNVEGHDCNMNTSTRSSLTTIHPCPDIKPG